MFQFHCWYPFRVIVCIFVSQPYNLVEQFVCPLAVNFGVDYLGDFIFWFSVNDYRCWWRFGTLLEYYESPKKELTSYAFEHLIYNLKSYNGIEI